jgi:hypothetical protein
MFTRNRTHVPKVTSFGGLSHFNPAVLYRLLAFADIDDLMDDRFAPQAVIHTQIGLEGLPTNGAALPFSTLELRRTRYPARFQPLITVLSKTSIDPTMTVVRTPNASACAESMTMNLTTLGAMAPANAMGACLRLKPASKG